MLRMDAPKPGAPGENMICHNAPPPTSGLHRAAPRNHVITEIDTWN